jgi:electron transport complex protein RnfE
MSQTTDNPFLNGLWKESPVFVQFLGMCPTLAVTNSVRNAIAMGLATTFVLVCSNGLISAVRKQVPNQVRIATFIAIAATMVTITDYVVKAISIDIYRALGPFLALIVVNCVILARAEAFAAKNGIVRSLADGLGNGLGFTLGLILLGTVREVLGAGSFLGVSLFGPNFEPWVLFLLPAGGFITLAFWLLVFAWYRDRQDRKDRLISAQQPVEARS